MAVDALVSIVQEKLITILQNEVALLMGVKQQIEKLSSRFRTIQAVLEDAESRRVKDNAVMIWLEKLKDVAYDVDNILDEWRTEALRSQAEGGDRGGCFNKKNVSKFLSPLSFFHYIHLRHNIGNRIKDAWKRLDDLTKEVTSLGLRVDSGERERADSEARRHEIRDREMGSQVDKSSIVGREREKDEIVGLLTRGRSREVKEVPVVVSVIGVGGLGKTTLAQIAYNDEEVKGHFDMRMWVCVSQDFDVNRITKSMIESATRSTCGLLDLAPLQDRLRGMLHEKRFLLVLDDVWSNDSEMWDKLRLPFQAGALGSRIVVTTRREDVAWAMGNTHMLRLGVLPNEHCWSLFSHQAFAHRSVEERSELEEIGWGIVKKCGGLPLAAKAIGSAMCSRRMRSEWELVLENEAWKLVYILEGVLPALLLSYYDLPPALKQCFTYCSIFPKDWVIEKDVIVKLWVAQGFIRSDGSEYMEVIGGQYFNELLSRSLLQDREWEYGKTYKMHDMVHDLAQFVAKGDCSVMHIETAPDLNLRETRHCLLLCGDEVALNSAKVHEAGMSGEYIRNHHFRRGIDKVALIPANLYESDKLRTLIIVTRPGMPVALCDLFDHLRYLRVLDLCGTGIVILPNTIGKLKHLRYLDLSGTSMYELPEVICNLYNLESLRLNDCAVLQRLPKGMKKMISLRHLEFEGAHMLEYLPQGIGRLTALQTLTCFIVGGNHGVGGCDLGELKHLNLLRGSLRISQLQNASSPDEARRAELYKKRHLHTIVLRYNYQLTYLGYTEVMEDEEKRRVEGVLEELRPHANLKQLLIYGYQGSKFPELMGDPSFSNLLRVELFDCTECEELPALWNLPMLRVLEINRCPLLAERYQKGGEDWHKIAHIHRIKIDDKAW